MSRSVTNSWTSLLINLYIHDVQSSGACFIDASTAKNQQYQAHLPMGYNEGAHLQGKGAVFGWHNPSWHTDQTMNEPIVLPDVVFTWRTLKFLHYSLDQTCPINSALVHFQASHVYLVSCFKPPSHPLPLCTASMIPKRRLVPKTLVTIQLVASLWFSVWKVAHVAYNRSWTKYCNKGITNLKSSTF